MTDTLTVPVVPGAADPLQRLQVYRFAMAAIRDATVDAGEMGRDPLMREVAGQLVRAAGSIAANVAEGYSRGTTVDRRRFYEYALGSARECLVWYEASPTPVPASRTDRLVSIRRLLLTMLRNSRRDAGADRGKFTDG